MTADPLDDTVAFVLVDPLADDAQWAMARYFSELDQRFESGVDPGSGGAAADATALASPNGAFLLLRSGDDVIGCGGVQRIDATTVEIKRMWIHPDWRGRRLGGRLLERLENEARTLDCRRIVLDTNSSLSEAIAMYTRAGYSSIERYNDNPYAQRWFAKDV